MGTDDPDNGKKKWQSYEQKKAAITKYQQKKERIVLWVSPEMKADVERKAALSGKSVTQYLIGLYMNDEVSE